MAQRPLTGGVSARVHALELALPDGRTETVVLRAFPDHDASDAQARVRRETTLLDHVHTVGVPAPVVRWSDPGGTTLGTPALVQDFVAGGSELSAPEVPAAMDQLGAVLGRLHTAPLPARTDDLPDRTDPRPELRAMLAALGENALDLDHLPAPPPPRPSVLHGDVWPGNLLWRDGQLVAVLDWEDAAVGDPLSDVACARCELTVAYGWSAAERFTRAWPGEVHPLRLALWELYVSAAALSAMSTWGLPPAVEAHRRAATTTFFRAAAARLAGGGCPAPSGPTPG